MFTRIQTRSVRCLKAVDQTLGAFRALVGPNASGITTVWHPKRPASALFQALEAGGVVASLRHDRSGREYLRFSPHFYNTEAELFRVAEVLRGALEVL